MDECPGFEKCEFPPCDHGCYVERRKLRMENDKKLKEKDTKETNG